MGEIKSTLDIVMEKTRHLTLSQEERAEQKQGEIRNRLRGLIQKYNDRKLKKGDLAEKLDLLKETHGLNTKDMLTRMLLEGLALGRSNESDMGLLNGICGIDVLEIETLFLDFNNQITSAFQKHSKKIKKNLAKMHRISGSAVVPNLERDNEWLTTVQEITSQYDRILVQRKAALTGDS
ncbi:hypothetical protein ACFL0O_00710 [Thermodesulfobacteriota bacterium]